jgi:hypothetical protein
VTGVRPVQIGVNQADSKPVCAQCQREIYRCSSFTYAAFAAAHGDNRQVIISWHGSRSYAPPDAERPDRASRLRTVNAIVTNAHYAGNAAVAE